MIQRLVSSLRSFWPAGAWGNRLLLLGIVLSPLLLFVLHSLYYNFWLIDDPFISYTVAKNMVEGHGILFNPGERVEGYSNFLYVLLLAAALKLGIGLEAFSPALGVICVGFVVLYLSAGRAFQYCRLPAIEPKASTVAAFLIATSLPMSYWAISGLETGFYAAVVFCGYVAAARAIHWSGQRRVTGSIWLSVILLFSAAITRVEGAMFAGPVAVMLVFQWRYLTRQERRQWLLAIGLLSLVFGGYHAWRYSYYGTLIPNTVRAKVGGGATSSLKSGLKYGAWGGFVESLPMAIFLLLYPLAKFLRRMLPTTLELLCLGAVALQGVFILGVGGDWMPYSRFLVPVLALVTILCGVAYMDIAAILKARDASKMVRDLFSFLLVGLIAISLGIEVVRTRALIGESRRNELVGPILELGAWMEENLPEGSVIALEEVGYIPFFTDKFYFMEFYGLVTPEIARHEGAHFFKDAADWILDQEPDYFVLMAGRSAVDGHYPLVHFYPGSLTIVYRTDFYRWYDPIKVVRRGAHSPFSTDMILFERREEPKEGEIEIPPALNVGDVEIEVVENDY